MRKPRNTNYARAATNIRQDACCKQQITRLPYWRPGDFVVREDLDKDEAVDRVEFLQAIVQDGDEIVSWVIYGVEDEFEECEVRRMATSDEAEAWLREHPNYVDPHTKKRPAPA